LSIGGQVTRRDNELTHTQAEIDAISVKETDFPEKLYNLGTPYGVSLNTRAKWKSACPEKEASVPRVSVGAAVFHMEFDGTNTVKAG
jgi:hypothetical protein